MPRKPTSPFGHIAFGKSGSVRKHIETLPSNKQGQESEVADRFALALSLEQGSDCSAEMLEEDNHDFVLRCGDRIWVVQATELVGREYLRPLSAEEYQEGQHGYTHLVQQEGGLFGVDTHAKDGSLVALIRRKIEKHYHQPTSPLWLLVWTVSSDFHALWVEGGEEVKAPSLRYAEEYLATNGAGPFAEIWFFNLHTRPRLIWARP